jgi:hypothetical protein
VVGPKKEGAICERCRGADHGASDGGGSPDVGVGGEEIVGYRYQAEDRGGKGRSAEVLAWYV